GDVPTVNEVLLDRFIAHAVYLRRLETGVVRDILGVLNQAERELVARLRRRYAVGERLGFTTQRVEAIVNDVRAVGAAAYADLNRRLTGELLDIGTYEAEFARRLIQTQLDRVRVGVGM